jgi:hypothetical protein
MAQRHDADHAAKPAQSSWRHDLHEDRSRLPRRSLMREQLAAAGRSVQNHEQINVEPCRDGTANGRHCLSDNHKWHFNKLAGFNNN